MIDLSNKNLVERAEELQKELHNFSKELSKGMKVNKKGIDYSDHTTIYFLLKLAELENKINNI